MRIAHVIPEFKMGGQERIALDLARTHAAEGHEVVVYSIVGLPDGGPFRAIFQAAGVATATVPKLPGVDPTLPVRLGLQFIRRGVDIVQTHNPMALTYGAPAGKLARAIVVHTKHGENPDRPRRVFLRRMAGKLADAFVAVSPMTAEAARRSRDVRESKLRIIANGIDLSNFAPDARIRAEVRRELGIPEDAWVVGTVGRLAPEKNQVMLVRAAAGLLGERARLVIVGDGSEADAIRRAVADTGTSAWVHLTGPRHDVGRMMVALDVFALPSLTEGLPLVIPEAMASGLPVFASAVGGVPDVIDEGVTGMLLPSEDESALRDALKHSLDDREWSRGLGRRAREVALERFSLVRMSRAYLDLYSELLALRRGTLRPATRVP